MPVSLIARRLREHGVPEGFVENELRRLAGRPPAPIPKDDPTKKADPAASADEKAPVPE